jgi:hypothetical protein
VFGFIRGVAKSDGFTRQRTVNEYGFAVNVGDTLTVKREGFDSGFDKWAVFYATGFSAATHADI